MEIKFPVIFGFLCLVTIGVDHGLLWGDSLYFPRNCFVACIEHKMCGCEWALYSTSNAIESLLGTHQLAILYLSTPSRLGCEYSIPETLNWKQKAGDRLARWFMRGVYRWKRAGTRRV